MKRNQSRANAIRMIVAALSTVSVSLASNLANPAAALPAARLAVGASYHLDGITITADSVPALMNRIELRACYSPTRLFNLGVDVGAVKMDVDSCTTARDTFGVFSGNFGFAGGGHIKLATPRFFKDRLGFVALGKAMYFNSENEEDAAYGGIDLAGAGGLQFHIKGLGFLTAGARVYLIRGTNRDYAGTEGEYANSNNVRGWVALDIFPRLETAGENRPYLSVEVSVSPDVEINERVPIRELGFSVCIGSVTGRLYGEAAGIEWEP